MRSSDYDRPREERVCTAAHLPPLDGSVLIGDHEKRDVITVGSGRIPDPVERSHRTGARLMRLQGILVIFLQGDSEVP